MINKNASFHVRNVSVALLIIFLLELSGCQLLIKRPAEPTLTPVRTVFKLKVGSNEILIDDKPVTLETIVREIDGSTYVPLRFLAEYLGAENLQYDPATEEITFLLTTYKTPVAVTPIPNK